LVAAFFTTGVSTTMAASRATFFISEVTVWVASLVASLTGSLTASVAFVMLLSFSAT
jgi:hypothetical protein